MCGMEAAVQTVQAHEALLEVREGRRLAYLLASTQEAVLGVEEGR